MAMPNPLNFTSQKDTVSSQSPSYRPTAAAAAAPITSTLSPSSPSTQQQQQQQLLLQYQRPKRLLVFQETKSPALESAYAPINTLGLPVSGSGPYFPGCLTTISDLPLKVIRSFTEVFNSPRYKNWAVVAAGPYHDPSEDGKFYAVVLEQIRDQPSNGGDATSR